VVGREIFYGIGEADKAIFAVVRGLFVLSWLSLPLKQVPPKEPENKPFSGKPPFICSSQMS